MHESIYCETANTKIMAIKRSKSIHEIAAAGFGKIPSTFFSLLKHFRFFMLRCYVDVVLLYFEKVTHNSTKTEIPCKYCSKRITIHQMEYTTMNKNKSFEWMYLIFLLCMDKKKNVPLLTTCIQIGMAYTIHTLYSAICISLFLATFSRLREYSHIREAALNGRKTTENCSWWNISRCY